MSGIDLRLLYSSLRSAHLYYWIMSFFYEQGDVFFDGLILVMMTTEVAWVAIGTTSASYIKDSNQQRTTLGKINCCLPIYLPHSTSLGHACCNYSLSNNIVASQKIVLLPTMSIK